MRLILLSWQQEYHKKPSDQHSSRACLRWRNVPICPDVSVGCLLPQESRMILYAFVLRESLAGSAAYERFCETIITLANHEPKRSKVKTSLGTATMEHNRTVRIEKARNG
jgi:hypothetical protein